MKVRSNINTNFVKVATTPNAAHKQAIRLAILNRESRYVISVRIGKKYILFVSPSFSRIYVAKVLLEYTDIILKPEYETTYYRIKDLREEAMQGIEQVKPQ